MLSIQFRGVRISKSIVRILLFSFGGLVLFFNSGGDEKPQIERPSTNSAEKLESTVSAVDETGSAPASEILEETRIVDFSNSASTEITLEEQSLLDEFVSMVDSFSTEFSNDLNDYIFDSDIIDYYEKNFAEIFQRPPTPPGVLIERVTSMRIDKDWGEAILKSGLSDREENDVRETVRRMYLENHEYSSMRESGEITTQEWANIVSDDEEILAAISNLVPEEKFSVLERHYTDKMSQIEPDPRREARRRDRVNVPAFDAIYRDDPILLESLLAAGADINAVSEYAPELSLLELAVRRESLEMTEVMLAYGADVESKDGYGNSMLHRAVLDGNVAMVELLLEAGASPLSRDPYGFTPAMQARLNRFESGEALYEELHTLLKSAEANLSY